MAAETRVGKMGTLPIWVFPSFPLAAVRRCEEEIERREKGPYLHCPLFVLKPENRKQNPQADYEALCRKASIVRMRAC
jgi:hypothetical protein